MLSFHRFLLQSPLIPELTSCWPECYLLWFVILLFLKVLFIFYYFIHSCPSCVVLCWTTPLIGEYTIQVSCMSHENLMLQTTDYNWLPYSLQSPLNWPSFILQIPFPRHLFSPVCDFLLLCGVARPESKRPLCLSPWRTWIVTMSLLAAQFIQFPRRAHERLCYGLVCSCAALWIWFCCEG